MLISEMRGLWLQQRYNQLAMAKTPEGKFRFPALSSGCLPAVYNRLERLLAAIDAAGYDYWLSNGETRYSMGAFRKNYIQIIKETDHHEWDEMKLQLGADKVESPLEAAISILYQMAFGVK